MHVPSRHTRPSSIPAVLLAGMALGLALLLATPVHATVIGKPVPAGTVSLPYIQWSASANGGLGGWIIVGTYPASALGSQSANTHLAGPASGAAASPTFRGLVPLDIPAALAGTGLTSTAGVLSVTTPAVAPAGAYYVSHANAGATAYVSDSALQNNGAQIGVGTAPTTTDRVSVNPSGTAENGLTVTMPSGAGGYGLVVYNSTKTQSSYIQTNYANIGGVGMGNGNISANQMAGGQNNYFSVNNYVTGYAGLVQPGNLYPSYASNGSLGIKGFTGQTGPLAAGIDALSANPFKFSNGGGLTNFGYATVATLALPSSPTFATATTGGTLAAGTYYYRVTAVSGAGETLASVEASKIVPAGTSTNTVTLTWTTVTGAESYTVYGRTTGAELKIGSAGANLTFTDTGSVTPSGALPAANTTGYVNSPTYQVGGVAGYTGTIPLTATGLKVAGGVITGYYTGGTTSAPAAPLVGN